jgi:predicted restriction endonuclease
MNSRLIRYMSSRPEQRKLRKFLLDNKEHSCIICQKNLPPYLLECAHIKPRCISNEIEKYDFNIVNWMCRNCHKIYDKGDISIDNGIMVESEYLKRFDFEGNFKISEYNRSNKYFYFHFKNIFK